MERPHGKSMTETAMRPPYGLAGTSILSGVRYVPASEELHVFIQLIKRKKKKKKIIHVINMFKQQR